MSRAPYIAIANPSGDLDVVSVAPLRAHLDALVADGCRRLVVNMADVGYMDSAATASLLAVARRLRTLGGLLSLSNVSPEVYHALSVACLVDFIPASRAGSRREVPALPPAARPRSRTALSVCPGGMATARDRIRSVLDSTSLTPDQAFDVLLACGEAIGNAVDHAASECVSVALETYADRVVATVTDDGPGFEVADGETPASETGSELRGRGITLMRMLADFVSIDRRPDRAGTVVTLVKLL